MFRVGTLGWAQMLLRLQRYLATGEPAPFFAADDTSAGASSNASGEGSEDATQDASQAASSRASG
jgi:hypothetical protein